MNFSRLTAMKPHIPETRGLLRDWIIAYFKAFGFMIPLILLGVFLLKIGVPKYITVGLIGVSYASLLGYLQWEIVSRIFPDLRMDRWMAATIAAIVVFGLFRAFWKPVLTENYGKGLAAIVQLSLGGTSLYLLGLLQAIVLRKHTSEWWDWARAHGFAVLFIFASVLLITFALSSLGVSDDWALFWALPVCLFGSLYIIGRFLVRIARFEAALQFVMYKLEEEENNSQSMASEDR